MTKIWDAIVDEWTFSSKPKKLFVVAALAVALIAIGGLMAS